MQQLIPLIIGLAEFFDRLSLPHAFGGALANNYWGIVRATVDVDCLVLIPAIQYQQVAEELSRMEFVIRDEAGIDRSVTAVALRNQAQESKLIELFCRGLRVELFVPFLPIQNEILKRAVRVPFENRELSVTTAEDLILLKLAFHRQKDLADIRGMLWVQRGQLDLDYLRLWSGKMLEDAIQHELDDLIRAYASP